MYINKDSYLLVNENFEFDKTKYFYLDDNTEMSKSYLDNFPYVDFEQLNGIVTNIILLEKPIIQSKPTIEDRVSNVETKTVTLEEQINVIFGGTV